MNHVPAKRTLVVGSRGLATASPRRWPTPGPRWFAWPALRRQLPGPDPDSLLYGATDDPAVVVSRRSTVRLAFVAVNSALQRAAARLLALCGRQSCETSATQYSDGNPHKRVTI